MHTVSGIAYEKNGLNCSPESIPNNKQMFPPFLFIFCCKTVLFDCQKYKTCLVSTYNCLSQWGAFVF